jgi:hypothetical protein
VTTEPESAVRRYLAYLADPSSAVDQEAVAEAEAAFAAATDPLGRLHAAADLEKARAADVGAIEEAFVAHAKAYAAAQDIPATAFAAVGVSPEVLVRAGFDVPAGRGGRASAGRSPGGRSSGAPRAAQVPVSHLKAVAVQMPKRFTLAQLADRAGGGSPATVRKAVEELIIEGRVTSLGPVPDHTGPGRAPTQYELV